MKIKNDIKNTGAVVSVCLGVVLSAVVTGLLCMLSALLITGEYINIDSLTVIAIIIQGVATFVGSLLVGSISRQKKVLMSVICSLAYMLLLLCISMLFFDGLNSGLWRGLVGNFVGCMLAVMTNSRQKRQGRPKRKHKRSR